MEPEREIGEIDRGVRAEKLLKDPLIVEAFDKVKEALHKAWETSPVRDSEGREELFRRIKATNDARSYLEQVVQNGKVALHYREEKRRFQLFRR